MNTQKLSRNVLIKIKDLIKELGEILGFKFQIIKKGDDKTSELLELITDIREKLRSKKEWELSDEIRSKLAEIDLIIEDK